MEEAVPSETLALVISEFYEELGMTIPHPDKPKGKRNNRNQTFSAICRELLFEIAEKHDLHFEREPSYSGQSYLDIA